MDRDSTARAVSAVSGRWSELVAHAETVAEEYRDDGWDPLVVHTGDVTPLFDDPFGLDVLSPGSEFEGVKALSDDVRFDTSHVYRGEEGSVRFLLIVAEASEERRSVLVPAYLSLEDVPRLEKRAREEGAMYTHIRPLSDDARVTFTHEDPEPFF